MDFMNLARSTIALFLNSPAKHMANFVGIDDRRVDELYVDLVNKINEERFQSIPAGDRIILLPQCLRHSKCPAPQDDEGFHCRECGRCKIADVMKLARKMKSKVFILPGGSMVPKLIHKYKPKAVLGVACYRELVLAANLVTKMKIPVQVVFLLRDGCRNTDVDLYELKDAMRNNGAVVG